MFRNLITLAFFFINFLLSQDPSSTFSFGFDLSDCNDLYTDKVKDVGGKVLGPLDISNPPNSINEDLIRKNWFLNFSDGISPKLYLGKAAKWRKPHIEKMLNITTAHCPNEVVSHAFVNTVANIILLYYDAVRNIMSGKGMGSGTEMGGDMNGTEGESGAGGDGIDQQEGGEAKTSAPAVAPAPPPPVKVTTTTPAAAAAPPAAAEPDTEAATPTPDDGNRRKRRTKREDASAAAAKTAAATAEAAAATTSAPPVEEEEEESKEETEPKFWETMIVIYDQCLTNQSSDLKFGTRGGLITEFAKKEAEGDSGFVDLQIIQELADKIPMLDIIVESVWFFYQVTAAVCYQKAPDNRISWASDFLHYFSRDFIATMMNLWRNPWISNYGPVFGDVDIYEGLYNLRACGVAHFQNLGIADIIPVRPFYVAADTNPRYGAHNARILV